MAVESGLVVGRCENSPLLCRRPLGVGFYDEYVPVEDSVRDLLGSEEYAACQQEWIRRSSVRFNSEPEPDFITSMLKEDMRDAGIEADRVRGVLSDEGFFRFLEGKAQLDGAGELDDQEYPDGEQPGTDHGGEQVEVLGYAHSAIASNAVWYLVARDSPRDLKALLKRQQIPHSAKFAGQLIGLLP